LKGRMSELNIEEIVAKVTQEVLARLGETAPANPGAKESGADVAGTIEHSMLNPDTTAAQIIKACKEARDLRMANVVVSPYYVTLAAESLRGSGVKVCTAVGFPHGAMSTAAKIVEAREAVKNGAEEMDVSMNILAIKNGEIDEAIKDLKAVIDTVRGKALVKAIYEQGLYSDAEKEVALNVAKSAGADFVKISNALTGKKAIVEDVKFVRGILGNGIGIKIDGGISDAKTVRELMAAGAQRFGCSKSVQIIKG
jgi:deoxyribose-phosphate aldolase